MSSGNIVLKLCKIQPHLPPKLAIAVEKQTDLWMVTVFLNALFTKHLLVQLLINITMVIVKILSKNVAITILVLCSFRNKSHEKNPEMYKYVWELKEKDINYFINWDTAMKLHKYVCESRKCDLCICEKLLIARVDPNVLLNKRDELMSKCRHTNKLTLKCFKDR